MEFVASYDRNGNINKKTESEELVIDFVIIFTAQ